jgi:stage IV sporulation protein FB
MLLGEPDPTQADLHFRVFGFPVRVSPYFWVGTLLLKLSGSGKVQPSDAAIWVAVVFVSILVHELGHAFLQRRYGGHPWITLYGFGGLASCGDCDPRPRAQIIIALAGPAAGFLFAALILLLLTVSGHFVAFQASWIPVIWMPFESPYVTIAVFYLLYVNIWWGIINLLPVYPLDGGRVSRQLFLVRNSNTGILRSLQLSAITGSLVAAYALWRRDYYLCFMFAYLAYGSFQAVKAEQEPWR